MRVALNLLYLLPGVVGGTETYAKYLIEALAAIDSTNEYVLFLNHESADFPLSVGANFRRVVSAVRASNRGTRYAWEQAILPWQLLAAKADIVHSLGYVGPFWTHCPHVVTIHDVNYRDPLVEMSGFKRRVLSTFVGGAATRANHILTMSEFSKSQIVRLLGVSPEKVTTAHLAPKRESAIPQHLRRTCHAPRPYIIAFGGSTPHKNIPRLVAAFAEIANRIPHQLVIVGRLPDNGSVAAAVSAAPIRDRVELTGYLSDDELNSVLRGADILAFPSLYEGFGLPILDAQAAGVAVVCSTAGSLPEVAGRGAILFEPTSITAISDALLRATGDPRVRSDLIEAGHENVERFSWLSTARTTLRVYEKMVTAAANP